MPPTYNVQLYQPHEKQRLFHASEARFRIAVCGRRWGKTVCLSQVLLKHMLETPELRTVWLSPTLRQSRLGADALLLALRQTGLLKHIKRANGEVAEIVLVNGSFTQFVSGTHPENARGFSYHMAVLDEAAYLNGSIWTDVIRATLADTQGRACFASTPAAKNWFYELFLMGQNADLKDQYESFSFPTSSNPYIPADEIENARRTLPEVVFKQEFLADFLDSGMGVFKNFRDCVREGGTLSGPIEGRSYVMGVDFARVKDFTVIVVMDRDSKQVVYFDRFNTIAWGFQLQKVEMAAKLFGAKVVCDATGLGDPIVDQLKKRGLTNIIPFSMHSMIAKTQLVENLAAQVEQKLVSFPNLDVLLNEMELYQVAVSDKSGKLLYSAPERAHDDCVMALALAVWGCKGQKLFEDWSVPIVDKIEQVDIYRPTVEDYQRVQNSWRWNPLTRSIDYPPAVFQKASRGNNGSGNDNSGSA